MGYRGLERIDNSNHALKRDLRTQYIGEVEADTCFDLFCGHGTYCRELYQPAFATVVCTDKRRDAIADVPAAANVHAYVGDNAGMIFRLIKQYGWPDFIDLDAYGNPDKPLVRALKLPPNKARFAVVATDGTFMARCRNRPVPEHYRYGKGVLWAPFSAGRADYPIIVRDNLEVWLGRVGYRLAAFDCILPRGQSVVNRAGLAQRD